MNDPILDQRTQQAKSSIDDALGVGQRVQQRLGGLPPTGAPPAPGQQQQQQQQRPQPQQQQPAPGQPPAVWPQMPGANLMLQQLASQYTQQQAPVPQAKSFARGGLAVF